MGGFNLRTVETIDRRRNPQSIPARRNRFHPLGLFPQCYARHAQPVRFLLQAAGIGEHHAREPTSATMST